MKSLLVLSALAAGVVAVPASASERVQLGVLSCDIQGGTSYVIGSNKAVDCEYRPSRGGSVQRYSGMISKLGLDLGMTQNGNLHWAVFGVNYNLGEGELAGNYYGANAEASIVVGAGANLLTGGPRTSFTLQPLSAQAQTGLNLAVAVAGLELTYSYK
ncbi:DUF992 domain-containing protein [Tianweitania sediminis]|uniref:DUF992 domain-containing protein n=1 Tax=Tianweitania sediminis TaxID=1502156 RepID=A0A8J7R5N5_9HYPH|nr:DUF992 domain-containing protein [Tianweitania sediminis]MBP0438222.1 DUF992 domain-containing protein [Tianweitania sediminis]